MVVHLSDDLERLVQEKVASGLYRSPDEVISKALEIDSGEVVLNTVEGS